MKQSIKYDDTPEDERKAIIDALQYMSAKKFKILVGMIKDGIGADSIHFAASFAGVQGFPIHSMIKRYKK